VTSAFTAAVSDYSTIWLVACVGLALSLLGFGMLRRQLEAHRDVEFEWVGHNRYRALENGIWRGLEAGRSVADQVLFGADLEDDDFKIMAESALRRTEGLEALMWAPRATGDNRYPVRFSEPLADAPFALGLDLASEPVIGDALERARRSGETAVSGRLQVGGEEDRIFGFAAVYPLFQGLGTGSSAVDPNHPVGFVVGLFRLPALAQAAIDSLEPRGVDCLLRDESGQAGQQFLDFYASRLSTAPALWDEASWREQAPDLSSEIFPVADRQWSVTCVPTPRFRSAEAFEKGPWVALAAGVFVTLLLTSYLVRSRQSMLHRLEMERTLREREEVFWQMTETVSEVFWATTPDRKRFLYISPAFEEVWGISCDELYRDPALFRQPIHPGDREVPDSALEEMHRSKAPVEATFRLRRGDGSVRWIRDRGFPVLDDSGEISRLVGFAEDITEERLARDALRSSEKRLRDLFNQSPDTILTVDPQGLVLFINRSTPELPAELAIGRDSEVLVPAGMRESYRSALDRVFRTGEIDHFDFERADSTWWELRLVPLIQQDVVVAAMVIVTDVTQNRDLQDQAARNARLASIGVLAAGVAHEINNPNNAIHFNASVLERAWGDAAPILSEYFRENGDFSLAGLPFSEASGTLPELLSQIGTNSKRIQRIVENLKHLSRKDRSELTSEADVAATLEAAVGILRKQTQEHTDRFELTVAEGLPAVRGSSQQLEQVFINVILNALQALPDRNCGVFVDASAPPGSGGVSIRVRDEGAGITKEHLEALTEPFFSTREDSGGTGLGLSISQSIIDKHGGRIEFESELGRGTTVTITLPVALAAEV
jgi:PAS domain S-box-containing protein